VKLARFRTADGVEAWGALDLSAGRLEVLQGGIVEWAPELVTTWSVAHALSGAVVGLEDVRLLEPLEPTAKVLGVGANYWAHLERLGRSERPSYLASFLKPRTAVIAPGDEIRWPALTATLDYEVELVAVLGAPITPLTTSAVPALLGYTVGNDISARDQKNDHGPDLVSMKANDATTPLGPWITTVDELGHPEGLDVVIRCSVNGEVRQEDSTKQMLWSVPEILDFFRQRISLAPGDVVFTGTTCGVGMEDGRYLRAGDVVETEVVGIGVLRNTVGARGARG
jgi:2-keto-4-pentenoate hydratase/2-oxohepta-3-ene-1,7-dioic acid hydratase in catechol pathway